MVVLPGKEIGPVALSQEESAAAEKASRQLLQFIDSGAQVGSEFQLTGGGGESVSVPRSAVRLLAAVLAQMARGGAVAVISTHAELTTQQAADLLNVSRPFLVKLLEQRQIPFRKVGKHRRVRLSDLIAFKQRSEEYSREVLERLAAQGQEMNMGY